MLAGKANCKLFEHARLLPFGHFSSIPVDAKKSTGSLTRRVLGLKSSAPGAGVNRKYCVLYSLQEL